MQQYVYDLLGNFLSKAGVAYTYGGAPERTCNRVMPHAVTATAGQSPAQYTYDCNGNMTGDGERTIQWTYDNKPKQITRGLSTTTFVYDGDGARVQKAVSGGTVVRYVGGLEIEGAARVKYFGVGGLTVATRVTGSPNAGLYFTHGDHQGSLQVLTTAAGDVVQRLSYQPFGETSSSGSVDFASRRYTGQIADPETGLYFYNARYYNPVLGRFLSPDPLVPTPGNPQSLNRYSYVENNPVRWTDPSGHFAQIIGIFVGVLAGTLAAEGLAWLGLEALAAGIAGAMVGGAVAGGVSAAIAGGNVAFSMMLGAAFGGIAAYTGPPLFAFYTSALGRFGAAVATGATLGAAFGAAGTAIHGGNVLQGALSGAVSGAVMAAVAYGAARLYARSEALEQGGPPGSGSHWPIGVRPAGLPVAEHLPLDGTRVTTEFGESTRTIRSIKAWISLAIFRQRAGGGILVGLPNRVGSTPSVMGKCNSL